MLQATSVTFHMTLHQNASLHVCISFVAIAPMFLVDMLMFASNPSAPVCRAFATIGYCRKGAECTERHVHECPDYSNTGVCGNKKCHLPHIDKADQMKKHAANNVGSRAVSTYDDDSDFISDEDNDSANSDIDSDGLEELTNRTDTSHALSQQRDFVHL